jgi:hypothetical protein
VRHVVSQVHERYTAGMQFRPVLADVQLHYPQYTEYSAAACTNNAKFTSPSYQPQGGACIFGIIRTGESWWGFESAVRFRLMFDPAGHLRDVYTDPVYTFL